MGRHSQSASLSSTLTDLSYLVASRSVRRAGHRSSGRAISPIAPLLTRAGGAAAVVTVAVSGGAYAAAQAGGPDIAPLASDSSLQALGQASMAGAVNTTSLHETSTVTTGSLPTVSTVSEESVQPHGSVEKPTDSLLKGETKVDTEGVDGVTRTTYQVTTVDGEEVSREEVSSVVVTEAVDEVILVGTGTPQQVAVAQAVEAVASGEAVPAAAGASASGAQAIARAMLSSYGWGDDQFSCLVNLWNRESGWNYQARNASSGAYGIPQALPGGKMASAGADWQTNPATQISWGLGYIAGRYGSPCAAWGHSNSVGWY